MDHCLRSKDHVNLIVLDKQPHLQYLSMEEADALCAQGAGVWDWASNVGPREEPDIVIAAAGDVPTQEALAAAELLREWTPELKVRFVNVVDLMALLPEKEHPHGYADSVFDDLFTPDRPVIFAFHGYPRAVHQLVHGRSNPGRFHVRGFSEQGTTTTPFDMVVLNKVSRYHLAIEALRRSLKRPPRWHELTAHCNEMLATHDDLHPRAPRGPARGARLDVARLSRGDQRLPRVVRGAVGQVGGGRRDPRPAEPAGRPGRGVPSGRADRAMPTSDHVLDLLLSRLERSGDSAAPVTAHEAAGVFYDDVHHDPDAAMSTIVDRYHAVADRFDAVLVVGSDYTDIASPTEFSFNARVAANLNSPMVLVVAGKGKTPEQVRVAADLAVGDARHHHASVLAVVANRVAREDVPATITALAGRRRRGTRIRHPHRPRPRLPHRPRADGRRPRHPDPRRRRAAGP